VRIARFALDDDVSYGLVGSARQDRTAPGDEVIASIIKTH